MAIHLHSLEKYIITNVFSKIFHYFTDARAVRKLEDLDCIELLLRPSSLFHGKARSANDNEIDKVNPSILIVFDNSGYNLDMATQTNATRTIITNIFHNFIFVSFSRESQKSKVLIRKRNTSNLVSSFIIHHAMRSLLIGALIFSFHFFKFGNCFFRVERTFPGKSLYQTEKNDFEDFFNRPGPWDDPELSPLLVGNENWRKLVVEKGSL